MTFLEHLNKFLEEHYNDFSTSIENTKDGYIIVFANVDEEKKIFEMLKDFGLDEYPCPTYYYDEIYITDCCRKVVECIPSHAFWQPDYVRIDDEIICSDCIDIETYIDTIKNSSSHCITKSLCPIEKLKELGFINFTQEKYNIEFSTNYDKDLENAMKEYNECVFYCAESTPFESEIVLLVRNKE